MITDMVKSLSKYKSRNLFYPRALNQQVQNQSEPQHGKQKPTERSCHSEKIFNHKNYRSKLENHSESEQKGKHSPIDAEVVQ